MFYTLTNQSARTGSYVYYKPIYTLLHIRMVGQSKNVRQR